MRDPDSGYIMANTVFTDIVESGLEGMCATEGVSEYEVSPRLVANRDGEGAEGRNQPYLEGAGSEGGVGGPAHLKSLGSSRVVGVHHDVKNGGDMWVKGLHH